MIFSQPLLRHGFISTGHGSSMWATPFSIRNLNWKVSIAQRKLSCKSPWKWLITSSKDVLSSIYCSSQIVEYLLNPFRKISSSTISKIMPSTCDLHGLATWLWMTFQKLFNRPGKSLKKFFVCLCEIFFFGLCKSHFILSSIVLKVVFDLYFPPCTDFFLAQHLCMHFVYILVQ